MEAKEDDETFSEFVRISCEDRVKKIKNKKKGNHYLIFKGLEALEVIKNSLSFEEFRGFIKGNILKYQLRLGKKDIIENETKKIEYYQNILIELEKDKNV